MKRELTETEKKKEYLRSYRRSLRREQQILDEIQQLRADKMFPSVANDGMPKGSRQSDLSGYAALLDEQIRKLKAERLERAIARQRIEDRISVMKNEDEQEVLRLRYIHGMSWEKIETETHYSRRKVLYIHGDALKNFKI